MHICDIFHLHIEGVLSKRALAGRRNSGRSGQGCRWTMAATLLETVPAASSHVTSAPRPDCLRSRWDHLFITFLFLHYTFSLSTHICVCIFTQWEITDFKTNQVNPWRTLDVLKRLYHSDRPLGLSCVFCTQCARVSERLRWWVRGFESVLWHTNILYNTASAICQCGELPHELNRDMEQKLCYILWTTVKLFYWIKKRTMDFHTYSI